jgi:arylsulfatase A-like enzyme
LLRERFFSKKKYVQQYYQDAQVVNRNVISWLERLRRGRFFVFIHYMETHDPYFVHPYNGVGYARVSNPNPDPSMAGRLSEVYDGELRYVDEAVGQLCDWLKQAGLYEQTLIVLTADHGQEFHEHGGWWHGKTLYDEQIHVPLVVKLPGGKQAGSVDRRMVRTIDITPSILTLAGIPPHASMQGKSFTGIMGQEWAGTEDVFSEEDHEGNVVHSLRSATWKLMTANRNNPRGLPPVSLFHLAEDPGETDNLATRRDELLELMTARLEEMKSLARGEAVPRQEREIDEATMERLRSLGYVE